MVKLKNGSEDIIGLIKIAVKEVIDEEGLVRREDLKYLPTREEYYAREDKTMVELKRIREITEVQTGQVS